MKMLITGGAGFLGQQLVARVLASGGLRLHDAAGARDQRVSQIVCFDQGQGALQDLTARGYPVAYKAYPMGHEVCAAQIADISRWLQQVLA